ncbi:MAG TPA: FAD-binding oxidoreductase, partial [Bryobacteraceae bacterium]|nr:FAD-binding oxidoreductase [Bryobacteraceae bacterium]
CTGLTGGAIPNGGWAISTSKLNHLEIQPGRAIAGPGVLLKDLQAAAAPTGQFYAPDPTEYTASIGGTIATNASGSRSFRYGDTRRHVLGLRVALMDGRVLALYRGDRVDFPVPTLPLPRTTKHTAGFRLQPDMDWIDLFVGSEGTLGVVTQADLQLLPSPEELLSGVVFFPGDDDALDAVDRWRSIAGLRMLEYFDRGALDLVGVRPAGAEAALLIEHEICGDSDLGLWQERIETSGALVDACWFASNDRDRERFRQFRHSVPERVNDRVRRNGFLKIGSDYAVPLDRNREMLAFYRKRLEEEFQGSYVIFGHIGDAHVHVNVLPRNQQEFECAKDLMIEFARQAVALGGTVSAEHGLGKRKAYLLSMQYSSAEIEAMKQVKRRLDPQWLLGVGNLLVD